MRDCEFVFWVDGGIFLAKDSATIDTMIESMRKEFDLDREDDFAGYFGFESLSARSLMMRSMSPVCLRCRDPSGKCSSSTPRYPAKSSSRSRSNSFLLDSIIVSMVAENPSQERCRRQPFLPVDYNLSPLLYRCRCSEVVFLGSCTSRGSYTVYVFLGIDNLFNTYFYRPKKNIMFNAAFECPLNGN
jgi:hypothetical protein